MNFELEKIHSWFQSNRLSLNVSKTNFLIFCGIHKKYDKSKIKLMLNGCNISQCQSVKFLGIMIDEHLTWDYHIQILTSKLSKNLGVMYRLKRFLTKDLLLMVYNSLFLPYLSYCNLVWASSSLSKLKKIITLQKKAIRNIVNADYIAHTKPFFKSLNLLNLNNIYKFQILIFMYKSSKKLLPSIFDDYFTNISTIHNYDTRVSAGLYVPFAHYNIRQRSLRVRGPSLWNELPILLRNANSINIFKSKLKKYLIEN